MAQQLLAAVDALYTHPDENVKRQANEWLLQWQQSVEAWSLSDAVLHDGNTPLDARYFCAQTLRTKVQRDFEELPGSAISSLRDSIMELLLMYAAQGPLIRTQLCLALAALVAHVPSSQWGPGGVLQWLITRLEGVPQDASIPVMLEMLTVLPEEANSYSRSVRPDRRRQLKDEMQNSSPMALQILASCLECPGSNTKSRVLEAFSKWLLLCPGACLPGPQLAHHPLTQAALEGLNSSDSFDGAVEALVELIYSTSSGGAPDQDWMALVSRIVPAVIALIPRFALSSRVAQAEARNEPTDSIPGADNADDEEVAKGMARLFAEIGEAYTAMIASGSPDAAKPVEALLEVAGHAEWEICSMSFTFWHRLSRHLNSGFSTSTTSDPQDYQQDDAKRKKPFLPAFTKLVALLCGRVQYQDFDAFDQLPRDEKDDFRELRASTSDTLLDAANVLGEDQTLQILMAPLQTLSQGQNPDWKVAEAALHCIRAVNKAVKTAGQPMMLALMQSLPQLPSIPKLQYTAAALVGDYAEWLNSTLSKGDLRDVMPQLLQMLTQDLHNKKTAGAAACALRDVCQACGGRLGPYLEALMQLYQHVQSGGVFASEKDASKIEEQDVQQVMTAVTLVVASLPEEQRRAAMGSMLTPILQQLQQSLQAGGLAGGHAGSANGVNGPAQDAKAEQSNKTLVLLDRLTNVVRFVEDPGAVTEALTQVLPLIEQALHQYSASSTAVERVCRPVRYGLRTAGKLAATGSLVTTLMAAVPRWFAAAPHCCYLYLASEMIKIFGDVPRQEGSLAMLLKQMLERACQGLQRLQDFTDNPDIGDDTFLLVGRALNYAPKLLLNDAQLVSVVLKSAQAGMIVQHREASETILRTVANLFNKETLERASKEATPQLLAIFKPLGPSYFRIFLAGVTGAVPSSRVEDISEAVVNILKLAQEDGIQWLGSALQSLPPTSCEPSDKEHVLRAANAVVRVGDLRSCVTLMDGALAELSDLVRRNRRSLDAAQNTLLV